MKSGIQMLLASLLVVVVLEQTNASICNYNVTYTENVTPTCTKENLALKLPNYEDPTTYYQCSDFGKYKAVPCPSGQYFTYAFQECRTCQTYIPPPQCGNLNINGAPNCQAIPQTTTILTTTTPATTTMLTTTMLTTTTSGKTTTTMMTTTAPPDEETTMMTTTTDDVSVSPPDS